MGFLIFFPKYFYKVLDALIFFLSLFLSLRLVPSMPPVDFKAYNLTSEAFINVSWSPVPSNHINGILLGYSLKYQRVQTSERQVSGVDEHTLTLRPTDLSVSLHVEAYSIYKIGVAAFTRKGMGPYTEYAYVGEYPD